MPKLGYYVQGDWNAQCDECGRGFKFSSLSLRWDSCWVCSACWEPRQPQDFLRGVRDDPSIPIARPRIIDLTPAGLTATWINNSLTVIPWSNNSSNLVPWIY